MSNILITGGAGFIGSQLAYKLCKQGHDIVIVDNMGMNFRLNTENGILIYPFLVSNLISPLVKV